MVNVDMLAWRALGGTDAVAEDYWSIGNVIPKLDDDQSLTLVSSEFNDDRVKMITRRRLDTGDTAEDFLIPLNEEINMVWAWNQNEVVWDYHD